MKPNENIKDLRLEILMECSQFELVPCTLALAVLCRINSYTDLNLHYKNVNAAKLYKSSTAGFSLWRYITNVNNRLQP